MNLKSKKPLVLVSAIFAILLLFVIMGSLDSDKGNHIGEAKSPSGSSIQKGRDYQEVIDDFEEKGFTNIQTEVIRDLIFGWLTKDGEVKSVSIGGDKDYSSDTWFPKDIAVVVTYHSFPLANPDPKPDPDPKPNPDPVIDANFPKENAIRAAVVAFTNRYANDVFKADGNTYDISKFHSYGDVSGFLMYIDSEGTWSVKSSNTWHVEHLRLIVNEFFTNVDANLDVQFDGENYIISNLTGSAPSYPDISVFKDEADYTLFFTVPQKLIDEDRVAVKELREDVAKRAFEYVGDAMFPYGIEYHWYTKLERHQQSYDGSWHFIVGVTITNQYGASREATAEAVVNNTTEAVEGFSVY